MSYFLNDKIYSQLKFKDLLNDNDILEIEVVNNETISFDFRGVQLPCNQQDIVTEIIKIVIDWGDGKIDKLTRPFAKQKTSIEIREDQEWKIVQHLFNVDKKYFYTNDKHKITIDFYNTFGECKTYVIYYKMFYKSIYDIGSDFSLLSANLTNDNNVSYTLRQDNTDSVIVTSNKKIKLNEIIGDVQYKEVSFDQVDNTLIQTDYTVFNWKEAPKVKWIQEPVIVSDETTDGKIMKFSFSLIGMEQKQNQDVKVQIQNFGIISKEYVIEQSDDGVYRFEKKLSEINSTESKIAESEISELYKINILTHGKTDIKGESQPKFVMNYRGENISSTKDVFDDIKVKINSKIRELSSVFASYKKYEKIIDKYQIRLSSENYEIVLYLTDLEIDQLGSNNDYTNYKLKEYSIPSDTYKISYKVFLKNGQISDEFDVVEYNFDFKNDIICKPTIESITGGDCSQSPDNKDVSLPTVIENDKCYFKIYPNIKNGNDIQLFRYDFTLTNDNNDETFEIVQKNKQYSESFLITKNDKETQQSFDENDSYKYYFQGNKIPDGIYTLELKNKRKYLNYYNYCESQPSSYTFNYVYPVPTIKKQSFVITPKISYSPTTKKQSISIVGNYAFESDDALDGMTLSIGEGDDIHFLQVDKMSGSVVLNNYYDSTEKVKLTFSAFRRGDDWKRTGSAEAIDALQPINFSELKDIIKTNGQHHHSFNAEEEFNWKGASVGNEIQKWNSIKRDTVYNIKKDKKYTIENKDYFTHSKYEKAFDKNKLFVFKVNQYTSTNGEIVRRFQPTTIFVSEPNPVSDVTDTGSDESNSTSVTNLINLKLKQDIDVHSVYNKNTDKCDVTVDFKLNETLTKQKLKYFRIKFKENNNESDKQYQYDLLNENLSINADTFSNTVSLPMGSYDVRVFGDSQVSATGTDDQNELLYDKMNDEGTESEQSQPSSQQIYISNDENELEEMVQVTTAQRVDGSSKIVLGWKLNHKLCQQVWLCYKTGSQNVYKEVNGRSYNRYTINTNESLDYHFKITSKFISPGGSTDDPKTIAKGSIPKKQ